MGARTELIPLNTPQVKARIDAEVRTPVEPTPVYRVGHWVLFTPDFDACVDWYQRWVGFLPTDVVTAADGIPCGGFFRLNRGSKPSDHHNLAVFASDHVGVHHVSTETLDVDAIGQGQQYLRKKGWKHFWGMGRHILGSQIFDYWLDPYGHEMEHYADGDVFDNSWQTQYHLMDRGGLWAWGDDVPPMMPKLSLTDLLKLVFGGADRRRIMMEIKQAMDRAPRPWLK